MVRDQDGIAMDNGKKKKVSINRLRGFDTQLASEIDAVRLFVNSLERAIDSCSASEALHDSYNLAKHIRAARAALTHAENLYASTGKFPYGDDTLFTNLDQELHDYEEYLNAVDDAFDTQCTCVSRSSLRNLSKDTLR